ncbi:MAG: winged helix-turn-helix domain-containing protein [Acidobacteriota bacterium]
MKELDRAIHEPARLRVMMVLAGAEEADFNFLRSALGLTSGNLSAHLDRLQKSGYIQIRKSFQGKMPKTECRLTRAGSAALAQYWKAIDAIRALDKRTP